MQHSQELCLVEGTTRRWERASVSSEVEVRKSKKGSQLGEKQKEPDEGRGRLGRVRSKGNRLHISRTEECQ